MLTNPFDINSCNLIYHYMTNDCFKHLVLSRKIAWQHRRILDKLMVSLIDETDITHFFSFYDRDEIIEMCKYDMGYNVLYSYNVNNIYCTYIMYCMMMHHSFAKSLIKYCTDFNISAIRIADSTKTYNKICIMDYKNLLSKMNEHETALLYKCSLRNAWILQCISI